MHFLVEAFSDQELDLLLRLPSRNRGIAQGRASALQGTAARRLLDDLAGAHAHLRRMQQMESEVDMERVRDNLLRRNLAFVRGRDKEGRPVVWTKSPQGVRELPKSRHGELFLPYLWGVCWAFALAAETPLKQVRFVYSHAGKAPLDFSLDYMSLHTAVDKAMGCFNERGPILVTGVNQGMKVMINSFLKVNPWWKASLTCSNSAGPILGPLNEPEDVPEGYLEGHGSPFIPCEEALGCFENLLARQGFNKMTLHSTIFPNANQLPWAGNLTEFYPSYPVQPNRPGTLKTRKPSPLRHLQSTTLKLSPIYRKSNKPCDATALAPVAEVPENSAEYDV